MDLRFIVKGTTDGDGRFYGALPEPIRPPEESRMALTGLWTTPIWPVLNQTEYVLLDVGGVAHAFKVRAGHYATADALCSTVNAAIGSEEVDVDEVTDAKEWIEQIKKAGQHTTLDANNRVDFAIENGVCVIKRLGSRIRSIWLSHDLAETLGFTDLTFHDNRISATARTSEDNLLHVCTPAVVKTPFADKYLSLLAVVHASSRTGKYIAVTPERPQYCVVARSELTVIEFEVLDFFGKPIKDLPLTLQLHITDGFYR